MNWEKTTILKDNGKKVSGIAPIIISASRSTDIPAFYSDWFFHRLNKGYCAWKNPFNRKLSYVSFEKVRVIVFWSKNPAPLIKDLNILRDRRINFYIQYTINDYKKEDLENNLLSLEKRIEIFKRMVDKAGFGKVVWRFDPLILGDFLSVEELLLKIKNIGDKLFGWTEKMVFSYIDIDDYRRVKNNLAKENIKYRSFSKQDMLEFAKGLGQLNKGWNYKITSCCENISLKEFNIEHNKCIDDVLMKKYFSDDKELMQFLDNTKEKLKDKGQRKFCGCIMSKDIGKYNSCPFLCKYCYANSSKEKTLKNFNNHKANLFGETI
jgi:DNA repair photolyase